jgi:hypothetical protein
VKGIIKVKKLHKSGLFVSDVDWDDCYKGDDNPKGNFVMIIEPLEGWDKGIINFQKTDGGYWVEGEGYILTGSKDILKSEVSEWKRKYKRKTVEFIEKEIKNDNSNREEK